MAGILLLPEGCAQGSRVLALHAGPREVAVDLDAPREGVLALVLSLLRLREVATSGARSTACLRAL